MKNYILREDQNQLLEKVKWVITNLILQKELKKNYIKLFPKKNLTMLFIGNTLLINNLNFIRFFLFIYI